MSASDLLIFVHQLGGEGGVPLGLPLVPRHAEGSDGRQWWRRGARLARRGAHDAQRVHYARFCRRLHVHEFLQFLLIARLCGVGGARETVAAVLEEILFPLTITVLLFCLAVYRDVALVFLKQTETTKIKLRSSFFIFSKQTD